MVGSKLAGVAPVMSLSELVEGVAHGQLRAAILAMGNPVALEARADSTG